MARLEPVRCGLGLVVGIALFGCEVRQDVALPIVEQGLIAFDARLGGWDAREEIFLIDRLGTGLRQLTHTPSPYFSGYPRWSPNKDRIAFISNRHGDEEIYVMDADGGNLTMLTNNPGDDWGQTWMPDGSAISFVSGPADSGRLYLIDLDGTNQRLVDEALGPVSGDVAWSASGRRFLFTSGRDGLGEDIYLFDLDVRLVSRITDSPGGSSSANAVWAKGGDHVLFASNRAGLWDIYRMNPDGSDVRRLTETTVGINGSWSLAQSPDGSELVFTSDRFGDSEVFLENMELFVVNVDGSNLRRITTNQWMDGHPDW